VIESWRKTPKNWDSVSFAILNEKTSPTKRSRAHERQHKLFIFTRFTMLSLVAEFPQAYRVKGIGVRWW